MNPYKLRTQLNLINYNTEITREDFDSLFYRTKSPSHSMAGMERVMTVKAAAVMYTARPSKAMRM